MATVFKRGGKNNRGGAYYISWYDHTGKRRTKSARTTDKATADRITAKLEADAALRREGVIDAALDAISSVIEADDRVAPNRLREQTPHGQSYEQTHHRHFEIHSVDL